MFIELSKELDLPLVIHSRSAGRYALDLLTSLGAERVIMHAFDGSASEAERGAAKGYYFSIPPSVVRSEQKQKMVRRLKLESLLLESDAPALGPERAAPNYPKNIKISAEYVARAKGLTLEKVVDVTMDNASQLLRIQTLF
ncbi:MAG: TatD family hydrolase [Nitrososphaerota archaeon]